jgi:hypothetical protein
MTVNLSLLVNMMSAERFLHYQVPPSLSSNPTSDIVHIPDWLHWSRLPDLTMSGLVFNTSVNSIMLYSNLMPICWCVLLNCNLVCLERDSSLLIVVDRLSRTELWPHRHRKLLTLLLFSLPSHSDSHNFLFSLWLDSILITLWPQVYFIAMS